MATGTSERTVLERRLGEQEGVEGKPKTGGDRGKRTAFVLPKKVAAFSRDVLGRPLRPYQAEIAAAIQASILGGKGHTFTVMMARQMGKNELSAHLEAWLLAHAAETGGTMVKAAPTFRPQ